MDSTGRYKDNIKWIWTVLVIGYTLAVFGNSLTPSDESSRQSIWLLMKICGLLDSLGLDSSWLTEHLIRKAAHFAEYFLLGILMRNCVASWRPVRPVEFLVPLWLGTLIPLADETIQLFVEGRSGQVSDVWLDMAGAFFGMAIAWAAGRRKPDGAEFQDASSV